jgi:hypothetical protein
LPGGVLNKRKDAREIDNCGLEPDKLGSFQPWVRCVCTKGTLGHRLNEDATAPYIKMKLGVIEVETKHRLLAVRVANAKKTFAPHIDAKSDLVQGPIGWNLELCTLETMHACAVRPLFAAGDRSAVKSPTLNGNRMAVSPGRDFIAPSAQPGEPLRDGKKCVHARTLAQSEGKAGRSALA